MLCCTTYLILTERCRVTCLFLPCPVVYTVDAHISSDLSPGMKRTLADLKALRTALITATSDLDERLSELDTVKTENQRLKYRVKHLLRSLDAEEKYALSLLSRVVTRCFFLPHRSDRCVSCIRDCLRM